MTETSGKNTASPQLPQPSFFQVPDVATVTTQMIFQSGLTRSNIADLGKKILLAFAAKYVYDNINKIVGSIFSAKTRLSLLLFLLRLLRCSKLRLLKSANELVEEVTSTRLDQTRLQLDLDSLNIKSDVKHGIFKLCNHWCLVDNHDNQIVIYSLSSMFNRLFLTNYKLPVANSNIITQYKLLVMSYNSLSSKAAAAANSSATSNTTTSSSSSDVNFIWSNPTRNLGMVNQTNDDFFIMMSTFVSKSLKLKDSATQAYIINGPAGVGKTTVVERLAAMNIVNTVLKVNMMNFVNYPEDFEAILNKVICPFPVKSDNEIWTIVFDEIDKWKNLWLLNRARDFVLSTTASVATNTSTGVGSNASTKLTYDRLVDYLTGLNNNFYNSLQRFIDGEILVKVPRLVVIFLTNHGEALWQLTVNDQVYPLPADYEAVKDRFTFFGLDFCGYKEVVSYLKLMYATLEEEYDEQLLLQIPSSIKISHRKLRQLRDSNLFQLSRIVSALQGYRNRAVIVMDAAITTTVTVDEELQNGNIKICLPADEYADSRQRSTAAVTAATSGLDNKQLSVSSNRTGTNSSDKLPSTSNTSSSDSNNAGKQRQSVSITMVTEDQDNSLLQEQLKTFSLYSDSDFVFRQATQDDISKIDHSLLQTVGINIPEYIKVGIMSDNNNDTRHRICFYRDTIGHLGAKLDADSEFQLHGEYSLWETLSPQLAQHGYHCHGNRFGEWDDKISRDGSHQQLLRYGRDGKLCGEQVYYHGENGRRLVSYENGVQHGLTREYQGEFLTHEANYVKGMLTGLVSWYSGDTGLKSTTAEYVDDRMHGMLINWYDDNRKKLEVEYRNDKKCGVQTEWDEYGNVTNTTNFAGDIHKD